MNGDLAAGDFAGGDVSVPWVLPVMDVSRFLACPARHGFERERGDGGDFVPRGSPVGLEFSRAVSGSVSGGEWKASDLISYDADTRSRSELDAQVAEASDFHRKWLSESGLKVVDRGVELKFRHGAMDLAGVASLLVSDGHGLWVMDLPMSPGSRHPPFRWPGLALLFWIAEQVDLGGSRGLKLRGAISGWFSRSSGRRGSFFVWDRMDMLSEAAGLLSNLSAIDAADFALRSPGIACGGCPDLDCAWNVEEGK